MSAGDCTNEFDFYSKASRNIQEQYDSKRLADQLEKTRLHGALTKEDSKVIQAAKFFLWLLQINTAVAIAQLRVEIPVLFVLLVHQKYHSMITMVTECFVV